MVSNLLVETSDTTGIGLPSHLLKLLTGTVGDLLVGRTHLRGVDLATAKLTLGAVETCVLLAIMHCRDNWLRKQGLPLSR